mmetsp:Transcript_31068/g.30522  ORF Transcript_31068/g.30522 Transcript_31068/m.30522 type:complete len:102 (+) Transcript_31068:1198-1503(+)
MRRVDVDCSKFIDYSEWIVATIDKEKLLSKEQLEFAFNLFDKDGDGSISALEIKDILCAGQGKIDTKVWEDIIKEIDTDGNGEIDFEEFSTMIRNIIRRDL